MTDDRPFRERFTRKVLIKLGVTVAIFAVLAVSARPGYRAFKRWRARGFAAEGEAMAAKDNWELALRKAQQAMQLSRSEEHSLRLMARVLTHINHDQALPHWHELIKTGKATLADRTAMATHALRVRDWNAARDQLLILLEKNPVPETLRLTSDYYRLQGDLPQAISYARKAHEADKDNSTNELFLASRLLAARDANETREAVALLQQVARTKDPPALDAISILVGNFQPTVEEANEYVRLIQEHPAHTPVHEFFALDLALKFNSGRRREIIDQAVAKYGKSTGATLVELGRWLRRNNELNRALELIPLETAYTSQDLFTIHLDSLAGLDRWADVEKALDSTRVPIDQFYVSLYQVRVAIELKRNELVPVAWSLAHRRAGENPRFVSTLAEYAEKIGAPEEAAKAWRRLIELTPNNKAAYLALIRALEQVGHTRDLRDVLKLMGERFPDEVAIRNDLAYLNLLLGEDLNTSAQMAEQLARGTPTMLAYRVTLALAYLRASKPGDAKAILSNINVDWDSVAPGWRAVYAAVLADTGDADSAKRVAQKIPTKALRPEERFLIQRLL